MMFCNTHKSVPFPEIIREASYCSIWEQIQKEAQIRHYAACSPFYSSPLPLKSTPFNPYTSKIHKHFLRLTLAPVAYLSKSLDNTIHSWPLSLCTFAAALLLKFKSNNNKQQQPQTISGIPSHNLFPPLSPSSPQSLLLFWILSL